MMTYDADIGTTNPRTIQFENVNEGRSYPFDDNTVLQSSNGSVLPDSVITDLHVVIPTGKDAYLSSVYISDKMLSACVKVFSGTALYAAASVTVVRSEFTPYIPYRLEKLSGSEDVGGCMTFGNIRFDDMSGSYRFKDRTIKITESAVSKFVPAGLRKIIDDRTGNSVSGDVKIDFPSYVMADGDLNGIYLRLKTGAAEALMSKCDKERPVNACGATPIQSINGIKPDSQNRMVIWFH